MFWDRVAGVYDIFANLINRKVHRELSSRVGALISKSDTVLECACGTGLLTGVIARHCKALLATDCSERMLKRAKKKYGTCRKIEFRSADILRLPYPDECFDLVVAANVIHLLDEPKRALAELDRVCRRDGKIVLPTYVNRSAEGKLAGFAKLIGKMGANFKKQFSVESYEEFIRSSGYDKFSLKLIEGRVPCALLVIQK